jgi:hypothetical protein
MEGAGMDFEGLIWFHVMWCWFGLSARCHAIPTGLMYAIPTITGLLSIGGVFVWRRFIKTRPI